MDGGDRVLHIGIRWRVVRAVARLTHSRCTYMVVKSTVERGVAGMARFAITDKIHRGHTHRQMPCRQITAWPATLVASRTI